MTRDELLKRVVELLEEAEDWTLTGDRAHLAEELVDLIALAVLSMAADQYAIGDEFDNFHADRMRAMAKEGTWRPR